MKIPNHIKQKMHRLARIQTTANELSKELDDLKITPLYKDLQENWDEHHGEIFMRVMIATLKQFGIDYDPKTEAAHVWLL